MNSFFFTLLVNVRFEISLMKNNASELNINGERHTYIYTIQQLTQLYKHAEHVQVPLPYVWCRYMYVLFVELIIVLWNDRFSGSYKYLIYNFISVFNCTIKLLKFSFLFVLN